MSLYGSLFSGVSGLAAHSAAFEALADRLAEINTVSYKGRASQFAAIDLSEAASADDLRFVRAGHLDVDGPGDLARPSIDFSYEARPFLEPVWTRFPIAQAPTVDDFNASALDFQQAKDELSAPGQVLIGAQLGGRFDFVDSRGDVILPGPPSAADPRWLDLTNVSHLSSATSEVSVVASFPSQLRVGDSFTVPTSVFDDLAGRHNLALEFTKADHVTFFGVLTAIPDSEFIVSDIPTPAAYFSDVLTDETTVDVRFAFKDFDETADTATFSVTLTPALGGTSDGAVSKTIEIQFGADGRLIGDSLRQFDVQWEDWPGLKDSVIALDFSALTFDGGATGDRAADGSTWLTHSVNDSGAVLKLDLSTGNSDDRFLSGAGAFVTLDQTGSLASPTDLTVEIDWADQETIAPNLRFVVDLGTPGANDGLSAFGDDFNLGPSQQNGFGRGALTDIMQTDAGFFAIFDNGTRLPVSPASADSIAVSAEALEAGAFFVDLGVLAHTGATVTLRPDATADPGDALGRGLLVGGATDDWLVGAAGASHIRGGAGVDRIIGGRQDDVLDGGAGDDRVFGGDGDDRVVGLSGRDLYDGMAGLDTLDLADVAGGVVSNGARVWTADGHIADVQGFEHISGSMFGDVLKAGASFVRMAGRAGDDALVGGGGGDRLYGNSGDDVLRGGDGDDYLAGGGGRDILNGGANDDVALGGDGDDVLTGFDGDDVLTGGAGDDRAQGHGGDDQLFGDAGVDRLKGGDGRDQIEGGDGGDHLLGGAGDDRIVGGAGWDFIVGGDGADVFVFAPGMGRDIIRDFVQGTDLLDATAYGFADFATDLAPRIKDVNGHATIDFANGDRLALIGVRSGDLDAGDFIGVA